MVTLQTINSIQTFLQNAFSFGLATSTSNLLNHLRNTHSLEINTKKIEHSERKTKAALCGSLNLEKSTSKEKFANARLLVEMCCRDLRPFNMVEQPGFVNYIKLLKPNISMPAATTLSRSALNDVYSAYSTAIKTFLDRSCPQHLSLVLDTWTDSFKRRSYINVRILFCLKFEIECITLKTEVFPHPHNKYTISSNIRETLCDFGLEKKIL